MSENKAFSFLCLSPTGNARLLYLAHTNRDYLQVKLRQLSEHFKLYTTIAPINGKEG